jgi:hypothetical protein
MTLNSISAISKLTDLSKSIIKLSVHYQHTDNCGGRYILDNAQDHEIMVSDLFDPAIGFNYLYYCMEARFKDGIRYSSGIYDGLHGNAIDKDVFFSHYSIPLNCRDALYDILGWKFIAANVLTIEDNYYNHPLRDTAEVLNQINWNEFNELYSKFEIHRVDQFDFDPSKAFCVIGNKTAIKF